MLGVQHAGEDEVLEDVSWTLGFEDGGVDHVEADFFLARVQGGADVDDCGGVAEEGLACWEGV